MENRNYSQFKVDNDIKSECRGSFWVLGGLCRPNRARGHVQLSYFDWTEFPQLKDISVELSVSVFALFVFCAASMFCAVQVVFNLAEKLSSSLAPSSCKIFQRRPHCLAFDEIRNHCSSRRRVCLC